jgi:DNA-binding response OmpR family regulator
MPTRKHILVVEDDPLVAEIVTEALGDEFDTSRAENSQEGVQRLSEGGIDLMLLDCTLPGGLGQNLLDTADGAGVRVVLMSGNPGMAAQVPGKRPFILKPFSLSGLLDMVRAHAGA